MLELANAQPLAIGGRRAIYFHPIEPDRCIKVLLPDLQPTVLKRSRHWLRRLHSARYYDENLQDLKIYDYLLQRHGDVLHLHLPAVYGMVATDLGNGLEVELIRDADKRVSLSGKEFTIVNGITPASVDAVGALESFLLRLKIQFRDPFPHNLAFQHQEDKTIRAVIIDGLARRSLTASLLLPPGVVRRRIARKMARLRKGLERTDQNRRKGVTPKAKGLLLRR